MLVATPLSSRQINQRGPRLRVSSPSRRGDASRSHALTPLHARFPSSASSYSRRCPPIRGCCLTSAAFLPRTEVEDLAHSAILLDLRRMHNREGNMGNPINLTASD